MSDDDDAELDQDSDPGTWSDDVWIEKLRLLYDNPNTMSVTTAAGVTGVSRATVYDDLRREREENPEEHFWDAAFVLGLDGKRYLQRNTQLGQFFARGVRLLYERGWSMRRIGDALGTSHASVSRWLDVW